MDIEYLKKRGEEFLKTSEYHLNNEMYDLGAFDLEQALQLFLKYTIFLKLKSYPPTHSLKSLYITLIQKKRLLNLKILLMKLLSF